MAMMLVDFTVPIRLESEANKHSHWTIKARRVKVQRQAIHLYGKKHMPVPFPVVVVMTRIAPRLLDDDNATRSCKAVRDELAALMGIDDRDPKVTWVVKQARGAVREYAVRVQMVVM